MPAIRMPADECCLSDSYEVSTFPICSGHRTLVLVCVSDCFRRGIWKDWRERNGVEILLWSSHREEQTFPALDDLEKHR